MPSLTEQSRQLLFSIRHTHYASSRQCGRDEDSDKSWGTIMTVPVASPRVSVLTDHGRGSSAARILAQSMYRYP